MWPQGGERKEQDKKEGVKVSYNEDSLKYETDLINAKQQVDILQCDLQGPRKEIQEKTIL